MYNQLGQYFNGQANKKPIERLDLHQVAKRLDIPRSNLYSAFHAGHDEGYIQKDYNNGRFTGYYVLATEVELLGELLAKRKAGKVKRIMPEKFITTRQVAERLGTDIQCIYTFRSQHKDKWPVTETQKGKSGRAILYPESIVAKLVPLADWKALGRQHQKNLMEARAKNNAKEAAYQAPKPDAVEVVGPASDVFDYRGMLKQHRAMNEEQKVIATVDKGLNWTDVLVELLDADLVDAAKWVSKNKLKAS